MNLPKITFGIVNCNRLYYLKACLESLLISTSDYYNKEIIIIDNASIEEGTSEYLLEKENKIITVIRQKERDPENEFAIALNKIVELSTGDLVCPLQGDMQFIANSGWLYEYAKIYKEFGDYIGSIALDAQRKVRINDHIPFGLFEESHLERPYRFYIDVKRNPVCGAGDVFYTKELINKIYPWNVKNKNHEGGQDSETEMLSKVKAMLEKGELGPRLFLTPQIPVSIAIYTDSRGTNARVRRNKRYGDYWPGNDNFLYYKMHEFEDIIRMRDLNDGLPVPIEIIAESLTENNLPIDSNGNWMKNPIRPELALPSDYEILYEDDEEDDIPYIANKSPSYVDEWLGDE